MSIPRTLACALAIIVMLTTCAAASINLSRLATSIAVSAFEGRLIESKPGRFSMRLPEGFSEAEESTIPVETIVGNIDMEAYLSMRGEGSMFMAAYADYPDSAFNAGTEPILDGAREGALESLNGKIISSKNLSLLGYPGRSLTFRGRSAGMTVYGRIDYYLVRPRVYLVLYVDRRRGAVKDRKIAAAFNSFTITQ